ncbi:MAG: alpha-amylase [Reyranella sp.]|uniref:alpha-amylase family glycosyl hydrolase n=1 Tax=Reyranella sp. TaxID=1929291 RepID=UPI001AD203F4|nr:alpha-amylase family glycosyl hydrolase [Reyranella sp.]MBN9089098.1 alpha-amylase [Reyranella sp.]
MTRSAPRYPSLLEINTRVWLRRLSREAGRPVTLATVDDAHLDDIARRGFDWVWLLSVWRTGAASRAVSRSNPAWQAEFRSALPDLTEDDICGSGFAIAAYEVDDALGGTAALAAFRSRLAARGTRLMLDFVPNHTALDHPWVRAHPDFYVQGSPGNEYRVDTDGGPRILAHGRDPNFPGWPDTLQLDYANAGLQAAQTKELATIAGQCDGLRCDMAMLLLPEVFQRTWGLTPAPFWPTAIATVREGHPRFTFLAEAYWGLEWDMQQQGFDYCNDKRLYDRLCQGDAGAVRAHLGAGLDYQDRLARFLENHDEPRAAATFPWPKHQAAGIVTCFAPGLRFFHQGQREGVRVKLPVHLCRAPVEAPDAEVATFYDRLLAALMSDGFRNGDWTPIPPQPAWAGNPTWQDFISYAWQVPEGGRYVVVVNYSDHQGQCRLRLPFAGLAGRHFRLVDMMGSEVYEREGNALKDPGLYVDLGPWRSNVFKLEALSGALALPTGFEPVF